ncbi:MAG: glycoside hydrolase family 57 protein [Candidatus Gastranaerophilales bacterium]|nr:glycoside hydrolase family 57 protein [Candidatus Gastranaerophilales bacterium]
MDTNGAKAYNMRMGKKISVAIVWHMHQPSYKDSKTGLYVMPWVRLHAIKDYLDMLLLLDEFENIKLNFNLVPLLLSQIEDYVYHEAHDILSKYTICDVEKLSIEEKNYIFDHFFDANYTNQIEPNKPFLKLYKKRFVENCETEDFSDEEISDLLAWFNLAWFDPLHIERNEEIRNLFEKRYGYTKEDREKIIELQREIMRQIIPSYKRLLDEGRIEISTSPYYHPIIPLMIDFEKAKTINKDIILPETVSALKSDATAQIKSSIEKIQSTFGCTPKGIWLPELCISPASLKILSDLNIKWTIGDEHTLAKSLKKEFVRNYRGILEDPFDLNQCYTFENKPNNIKILFRNAALSSLINFEYSNFDSLVAANDLYERIKTSQDKLEASPLDNHILTIALDGENCWENYSKDGIDFLRAFYTLLDKDETINVTTISDYIDNLKISKPIKKIVPGSWINNAFDMWIGDSIKNLAWDYLNKTKHDFMIAVKNENYDNEAIQKAHKELLVAQSSDWFWWYGEPNNSGRDEIFDSLFRNHLISVYNYLNLPAPPYLNIALDNFVGKPSKHPKRLISPMITGTYTSSPEWNQAGCIEIPQGPTFANKMIDKIFFGNDETNIYVRFDFNKFYFEENTNDIYPNELFIYMAKRDAMNYSSIRLRNKNENIPQILKYVYTHEIQVPVNKNRILPVIFTEALENSMWKVNLMHNINYFYNETLEMQIPFDDLKLNPQEGIYMIFIVCKSNIINQVLPLDNAIYIERPV